MAHLRCKTLRSHHTHMNNGVPPPKHLPSKLHPLQPCALLLSRSPLTPSCQMFYCTSTCRRAVMYVKGCEVSRDVKYPEKKIQNRPDCSWKRFVLLAPANAISDGWRYIGETAFNSNLSQVCRPHHLCNPPSYISAARKTFDRVPPILLG